MFNFPFKFSVTDTCFLILLKLAVEDRVGFACLAHFPLLQRQSSALCNEPIACSSQEAEPICLTNPNTHRAGYLTLPWPRQSH